MSSGLVTATVEIFHDAECGRLETEPVLEGIEVVAAIAGRFEIARQDRLLRISKPDSEHFQPRNVRWPNFSTDLAVVLTERPIELDDTETYSEVVNSWTTGVAIGANRVAIVNMQNLHLPKYTTAHELGHLMGLKKEGTWFAADFGRHCRREDCLMYHGALTAEEIRRVEATGTRKLFERTRVLKPTYRATLKRRNDSFCSECSDQLEQEGQRRALGKIGITLPKFKAVRY